MSEYISNTVEQSPEVDDMKLDDTNSFVYKNVRVQNYGENGIISGEFIEAAIPSNVKKENLAESLAESKRSLAKTLKSLDTVLDANELKKLLKNPS